MKGFRNKYRDWKKERLKKIYKYRKLVERKRESWREKLEEKGKQRNCHRMREKKKLKVKRE